MLKINEEIYIKFEFKKEKTGTRGTMLKKSSTYKLVKNCRGTRQLRNFCYLQVHEYNLSPAILPSCSPALFLRREDRKWTRHITMTANPRDETRKQSAVLLDAKHLYEHFTSYASLARINGSVRVLCNSFLIFLV